MLMLTRRIGESIMIGENVVISINGVKGNQVRIGVQAPREVAVHREEIFQRINGTVPPKRDNKGWMQPGVSIDHVPTDGDHDSDT